MCSFHDSFESRVTPRYFTEFEKGICIPSIFSNFLPSYFFLVLLDFVKSKATVLLALNVSPHFFPHAERSLHTLFSFWAMSSMFLPPIIPFPSSANSSPLTPFEFSIFAASSKAIIQNLALQTPPCITTHLMRAVCELTP